MFERKMRRWNTMTINEVREFTKDATSLSVWNEDLSKPSLVTSSRLAGKEMKFAFDDGFEIAYSFSDERNLFWKMPEGAQSEEIYNVSPAPGAEEIMFLHHYMTGFELPRCIDIVFDFETGYAVMIDAALGEPTNPREVVKKIRFGRIEGTDLSANYEKPDFTSELNGKSIIWRAPERPSRGIQYIFSSQKYNTYCMYFKDSNDCWMGTHPCDYIKIKENIYLISDIEERQTGLILNMLMNLNVMHDVQTGFGIAGAVGQPLRLETWMHSNRSGEFCEPFVDLEK